MNRKILVCDDDDGILEMVSLLLRSNGYQVITESSGKGVLERIESENPDLLLLDLWMPQQRGDEIVRHIRSNPKTQHLPVLLFSASRDGEGIAREAGASDYLDKPFSIHDLINKIQSNLQ